MSVNYSLGNYKYGCFSSNPYTMNTSNLLGKSCSLGQPNVPFVVCQFVISLVISHFNFDDRIYAMTVPVPGHCFSFHQVG